MFQGFRVLAIWSFWGSAHSPIRGPRPAARGPSNAARVLHRPHPACGPRPADHSREPAPNIRLYPKQSKVGPIDLQISGLKVGILYPLGALV